MVDAQKFIQADHVIREEAEQKETAWINPDFLPIGVTDSV